MLLVFLFIGFATAQQNYVSVPTSQGVVQGKTVNYGNDRNQLYYGQADVFLGIPYAQAPVGDLRFRAPRSANNFQSVYDATYYRPKCPQATSTDQTSEDCLYLNVYTQQSGNSSASMAVMVFIDGANGLTTGGTDETQLKGTVRNLVSRGVVVVTFQYRLGALGFFSAQTTEFQSNNGMLDQVKALEWVQRDISNFGGDPKRITLCGQGDGGCAVSAHTLSPLSQNLFQQAIIQSGTINSCYSADGTTLNTASQAGTTPVLQYDQGLPYTPLNTQQNQQGLNYNQQNTNSQGQYQNYNQNQQTTYNHGSNSQFTNSQTSSQGSAAQGSNYNSNQGGLNFNYNTNSYNSGQYTNSNGQQVGGANEMNGQNGQVFYNDGVQVNNQQGTNNNQNSNTNQATGYNSANAQYDQAFVNPSQEIAQQLCNVTSEQWRTGQVGNLRNCLSNYTVDFIVQTQGSRVATWVIVRDNYFLPDSIENLAARRPPIPIIIGTVQDEDADYAFKLVANGQASQQSEDQMFNNWLVDFARKNKVNQTTANEIGNIVSQNYNISSSSQTGASTSPQYDAQNSGNMGYSNQNQNSYGNANLGQSTNYQNNQFNNGQVQQNSGTSGYSNQNMQNAGYSNQNSGYSNQNTQYVGYSNQYNQNGYSNQNTQNTGYNNQYNQNTGYSNQYNQNTQNSGYSNQNTQNTGYSNQNTQNVGNANMGQQQYDQPNSGAVSVSNNAQVIESLKTMSTVSSDAGIVSQTATEIQTFIQNGNQYVRVYQFNYVSDLGRQNVPDLGTWKPVFKGQDQAFIFMSETIWSTGNPTSQDRAVADQMGEKWTQFAKEGQVSNWQPSNTNNYPYCNLNTQSTQQTGYAQQARTVFNDQVNPIVQQAQQSSSQSSNQYPSPSLQYDPSLPTGTNYVPNPARGQYTQNGNSSTFQISFNLNDYPLPQIRPVGCC